MPYTLVPLTHCPLSLGQLLNNDHGDDWVAQFSLPSAGVMISGFWDPAPLRTPCSLGSLLLLPLLLCPPFVLSLSQVNKILKKNLFVFDFDMKIYLRSSPEIRFIQLFIHSHFKFIVI